MLSVAIITYNEELRLGRTLEAIKDIADEIIIIDSFSTDKTVEIAESYKAKVYQIPWPGYGKQKNNAIEKCTKEWILLIDADEVITPPLAKEILETIKKNALNVYKIPQTSVCFGKRIHFGGWSAVSGIKLFKKNSGSFSLEAVHEEFLTDEKVGLLKNRFDHYTYKDYSDYLTKFNRYTSEGAEAALKKNKSSGFFNIVLNPIFKFIRMYIFRLGFLDGLEGLSLAVLSALYTSVKYLKLRELRRQNKANEKR